MADRFSQFGQAFNLAMTADDVLVTLGMAEKGRPIGEVGRRVCRAAARLLKRMADGGDRCVQAVFSAAPESVSQVALYNDYAVPALKEADIKVPVNEDDVRSTFEDIRKPLEAIEQGALGDLDLETTRSFFLALASHSTARL